MEQGSLLLQAAARKKEGEGEGEEEEGEEEGEEEEGEEEGEEEEHFLSRKIKDKVIYCIPIYIKTVLQYTYCILVYILTVL